MAFQALKENLSSAPIRAYPQVNLLFILNVDASPTVEVGAELSQKVGNIERVVAYFRLLQFKNQESQIARWIERL